MHTSEIFIGGRWQAPASGETYATINPATEEVSAQVGGATSGTWILPSRRPAARSTRAPGRGWPRPSARVSCGSSPT